MKTIPFHKYHGTGNDFILVNALAPNIATLNWPQLAPHWCRRHFGIGADGIILVLPSQNADFGMRIINADGSESAQCGNGIRCFSRFVLESDLIHRPAFSVETPAGIYSPEIVERTTRDWDIRVNMGRPILDRDQIPVSATLANQVIESPVKIAGQDYRITAVSMGNPHAVVFVPDIRAVALSVIGPQFEMAPYFPKRVNTEFVQIHNRIEVSMVVWERGAGATLACGSGACAVVVAGIITGRLDRRCTVHLPGGDLLIEWPSDHDVVWMTGPATHVFSGHVTLPS